MTTTREQAEQAADRLRDELFVTLSELERRGKQAVDVRYQLSQHINVVIGMGVGALVLATLAVGTTALRRKSRGALLLREHVRSLIRAWEHPERVARSRKQQKAPVTLAQKFAMALVSAAGTQLGRYAGKQWVQGRQTPALTTPAAWAP